MVLALTAFGMTLFWFCVMMVIGLLPTLILGRRGGAHSKRRKQDGVADTSIAATFPSSSSKGVGAEGAGSVRYAVYLRGRSKMGKSKKKGG